MECRVDQILPLGDQGGAGNLIICNIVLMHIAEAVLNEKGRIDPHKIDLMGRMGRMYYVRASGSAVEEIVQEVNVMGIGFDGLPTALRHSKVFTGNNLGQLAGMAALPDASVAMTLAATDPRVQAALATTDAQRELAVYAKEMLDENHLELGAQLAVLSISV
jgi:hypothetical protein